MNDLPNVWLDYIAQHNRKAVGGRRGLKIPHYLGGTSSKHWRTARC